MRGLKRSILGVLPVTAALGAHAPSFSVGGVTFYLFRIIVLVGVALTPIISYNIKWLDNWYSRIYVYVGYVWVAWGGVSIYWAPQITGAINDVAAVAFGVSVGVLVLNLDGFTEEGVSYLCSGWVVAFWVASGVALWELLTGNHLPGSYHLENNPNVGSRLVAVSTFGNPNNYAAFLVLCYPFLVYKIQEKGSKAITYISILSVFVLYLMLFVTASRVSLLAVFLQTVVYVFIFGSKRRVLYTVIFLFLLSSYLVWAGFSVSDYRLWEKMISITSGEETLEQGSVGIRFNLLLSGLWMLLKTYGFGVGAAGFEETMRSESVPFYTSGIVNPHNFWIEVLSEYGLVVFVLFVSYMFRVFVMALRVGVHESLYSRVIVIMLVGYVFAVLANSTYMTISINWMFISSVVAIASCNYECQKL